MKLVMAFSSEINVLIINAMCSLVNFCQTSEVPLSANHSWSLSEAYVNIDINITIPHI